MRFYTLRLMIHSLIISAIFYVTCIADNYKLILSNALIYLLPFTMDFKEKSLDKSYYPSRYKIGLYTVSVVCFLIVMFMTLNYLGLKIPFNSGLRLILKIFFIVIYCGVFAIVLLDWYFLKDSEQELVLAENAGRDSVRDKQLKANDRQEKRQLVLKQDYKEHITNMSQKKTRKK
ncbi:hypothetical protein RT939_001313 [Staphylococcus pseudintermedius]|nr:hypothetical protein [Staphylococcus pseudintermedius]